MANTERIINHQDGLDIVTQLTAIAAQQSAPEVTVSKSGSTTTITTKDTVHGTTTATVSDGAQGDPGTSPVANVTKSGKVATITITDATGTTTETVSDGNTSWSDFNTANPIITGGTGATTAADARTNLGLGTAATADSTTSITNAGTGLPTSGTIYSYTAPVVITAAGGAAPSDTRALWVTPAS